MLDHVTVKVLGGRFTSVRSEEHNSDLLCNLISLYLRLKDYVRKQIDNVRKKLEN